jgi:hypothetical protein
MDEASAIEQIGTVPHCDPRILHAPGECEFCDQRAELQALRRVWGIAFTGHAPVKRGDGAMELPCPADAARGDTHQKWGGNRAAKPAPVDRTACDVVGAAAAPGVADTSDRGDGQQRGYVVLSDAERARGFVRPVRRSYVHLKCGAVTTMGERLAETYARDPAFYDGTFCATCRAHFPVGPEGEFVWKGTNEKVGT